MPPHAREQACSWPTPWRTLPPPATATATPPLPLRTVAEERPCVASSPFSCGPVCGAKESRFRHPANSRLQLLDCGHRVSVPSGWALHRFGLHFLRRQRPSGGRQQRITPNCHRPRFPRRRRRRRRHLPRFLLLPSYCQRRLLRSSCWLVSSPSLTGWRVPVVPFSSALRRRAVVRTASVWMLATCP